MSEVKSLEEIKKFWPKKAPNINNLEKYVSKYKNEKIKYRYFLDFESLHYCTTRSKIVSSLQKC